MPCLPKKTHQSNAFRVKSSIIQSFTSNEGKTLFEVRSGWMHDEAHELETCRRGAVSERPKA